METAYLIVYLIAVLAFLTYAAFVLRVVGIQPSWSHTYYALGKVKSWYKYLFQALMAGLMFLLLPVVAAVTAGQWWQFVGLFVLFPIGLVGAAPRFITKEKDLEKGVHSGGAYISAAASIIWVVLVSIYLHPHAWILIPNCAFISFLLYKLSSHPNTKLWWAEWAGFSWFLATLGILVFKMVP